MMFDIIYLYISMHLVCQIYAEERISSTTALLQTP